MGCDLREQTAQTQEQEHSEGWNHCCQGEPEQETPGDHCPPSCHCACCHSPSVLPAVKHHLPSFTSEGAQPGLVRRFHDFDFRHLIWHPPQAGYSFFPPSIKISENYVFAES